MVTAHVLHIDHFLFFLCALVTVPAFTLPIEAQDLALANVAGSP